MKNLGYARLAIAATLIGMGANPSKATNAVCQAKTEDDLRQTFHSQSASLIAKRAASLKPKIIKASRKSHRKAA